MNHSIGHCFNNLTDGQAMSTSGMQPVHSPPHSVRTLIRSENQWKAQRQLAAALFVLLMEKRAHENDAAPGAPTGALFTFSNVQSVELFITADSNVRPPATRAAGVSPIIRSGASQEREIPRLEQLTRHASATSAHRRSFNVPRRAGTSKGIDDCSTTR